MTNNDRLTSGQRMAGDVTPESLLEGFRGPGLMKMVIATVVLHAVVLLGSSVPFLIKQLSGDDASKLTKEERVTQAVQDATSALRKIAETHGLNPQDISDRFTSGGTRAGKESTSSPAVSPPAETPEKPKSTIEEETEKVTPGPAMPSVAPKDDIF